MTIAYDNSLRQPMTAIESYCLREQLTRTSQCLLTLARQSKDLKTKTFDEETNKLNLEVIY